jgi:outer membrane protein OmpA-like peptidoglycan-associated protein
MKRSAAILLSLGAWAAAQDVQYPNLVQWNGTRGLSQTRSAEALGEGYLTLSAVGAGYEVDQGVAGRTPKSGTDVITGTYAFGLGISDWADLSGWFSHYGTMNGDGTFPNPKSGMGSSGLQIQLSAPWDTMFPLRMAVQGGLVAGTADAALQQGWTAAGNPRPDGWAYFETRTGYDFQLRLLQTLRTGSASFPVRIHVNEGFVSSVDADRSMLCLFDGGLELDPLPALTLALEAHTRTRLAAYDPSTDPTWGSASFTFHLPADVHFQVGGDLALSKSRSDVDKNSLEPWRAFAALSVGFDLAASAKAARAEARRNDSLDRVGLQAKIAAGDLAATKLNTRIDSLRYVMAQQKAHADSMARKAAEDSARQTLALENCRKEGSSARNQIARVSDSLARRSAMDSAALAEARRQIEEERLKRGDLEASFLRTGMMNLDAVYFDLGKASITANSRPYLNLIGAILAKYPKLRFEVGGHTDNRGQPKTNLRLSQARAQAVQNYLVQNRPEIGDHIVAKGYGDTKPKATNKTAEGREMNRRVEIVVTNLDALKEYTQQQGSQPVPAAKP